MATGKYHIPIAQVHSSPSSDPGYAGIYLWDVAQQQALRIPPPPSTMSEKHFYTRCAWLHFEETELPVLILGSMRGDVFIWKWSAIKGVSVIPLF